MKIGTARKPRKHKRGKGLNRKKRRFSYILLTIYILFQIYTCLKLSTFAFLFSDSAAVGTYESDIVPIFEKVPTRVLLEIKNASHLLYNVIFRYQHIQSCCHLKMPK